MRCVVVGVRVGVGGWGLHGFTVGNNPTGVFLTYNWIQGFNKYKQQQQQQQQIIIIIILKKL